MSTGTSKVDKLLKMPSNSISEGVIFQNFLGGMLHMPVCFAHYECTVNPTSTMMTGLVVPPPFQKSRSTPGIVSTFLVIVPCQFGNNPHIFIIGLLYQLATLYTGGYKHSKYVGDVATGV